jgi:hypothetical protein
MWVYMQVYLSVSCEIKLRGALLCRFRFPETGLGPNTHISSLPPFEGIFSPSRSVFMIP